MSSTQNSTDDPTARKLHIDIDRENWTTETQGINHISIRNDDLEIRVVDTGDSYRLTVNVFVAYNDRYEENRETRVRTHEQEFQNINAVNDLVNCIAAYPEEFL